MSINLMNKIALQIAIETGVLKYVDKNKTHIVATGAEIERAYEYVNSCPSHVIKTVFKHRRHLRDCVRGVVYGYAPEMKKSQIPKGFVPKK